MTAAIIASGISKKYRIDRLRRSRQIREVFTNLLKSPFKSKQIETFWALKDVSFEIEQGEVLGIIGRNGAGKSTLLKVLSKITYPTSGSIEVNGRIASLLEVGTGFHEELTGRENIYLNGSILGMKKKEIDKRIDEIIEFSGVEKFIDTPIKRYSSGMRLRLGFAVAAHLNSDILFIDEVLAVGDAEFQKKCLKAMDELSGGGRTVLFVSHNMAAVENLCSRAILLERGSVVKDGPAKDIISYYMSSFIRSGGQGFDLSAVTDREGSGEAHLTRLEILDGDGQPRTALRSGEGFVARLHYKSDSKIISPYFGLDFFTEMGTKVASLNTWSSGYNIPFFEQGEGSIETKVEFFNLMPGRYFLTLWLAKPHHFYDKLEHCAFIDVEPSDVFNSGKGMEKHWGLVFFQNEWKLAGE